MDWFSICISSIALVGTSYQAYAAYRQNRQSVRPYIYAFYDITRNDKGNDILSFYISNIGLGPALIDDWHIDHNGKAYRDNETFDLFAQKFRDFKVVWYKPKAGIAVNDPVKILEIIIDLTRDCYGDDLPDQIEKEYILCIKYTSFHGESYEYKTTDHLCHDGCRVDQAR